MEVKVANKEVNVNVTDKALIKDVLTSARSGATSGGIEKGIKRGINAIKGAQNARPMLDNFVEDLCKEGVTIRVFYKGDRVVTIGSEAHSKFTRFVTGTKGIQIDNSVKLAQMTV